MLRWQRGPIRLERSEHWTVQIGQVWIDREAFRWRVVHCNHLRGQRIAEPLLGLDQAFSLERLEHQLPLTTDTGLGGRWRVRSFSNRICDRLWESC